MAATETHAQPSSTQIQRTVRQTDKNTSIYDDRIIWKLGLNKAPVGWSPTERAIPRNELVQLELREANATTHTHTQALNNPELLHNDISNRHSKSNKYTISNKMGKISLDFPHIMTDSRKHGCFKSVQILKRSLAKGCFKAMHAVICLIVTPRRLLFYLQLINPVL